LTQVSPAPLNSGPAIRPALLAGGVSPGFARALTALLPSVGGPAAANPAPPLLPEGATPEAMLRQLLAGTGKDLPDGTLDEQAEDDDAPGADPSFAWFAMPAPLIESAPIFIQPLPAAQAMMLPEGEAVPLSTIVPALLPPEPAASLVEGDAAVTAPPLEPIVEVAIELPAAPVRDSLPVRDPRVGIQAPTPIPLAMLQTAAATSQPLAAALASAGIDLPEQFRRATARDPLSAITASPTTAPDSVRPNIVQAVSDAQQPAIDLQNRQAMAAMIDRIEAMRDTPGSRDTSIRLSPDALGAVDVSIRQEGDRIHVRFVAESAAARAMLAEAQPRLLEIAEARGIKLGQTSIAGGDAGQDGQRQQAAPAAPAPAPAPASTRTGETTQSTTDERIA